jgi:aspartyl protease family protein
MMRDDEEDEDLDVPVTEGMRGGALRWALVWLAAGLVTVLLVPYLFRTGAAPNVAAAPAAAPVQAVARATYAADRYGHFVLDAVVNGEPIRFLVDTGASFVTLTTEDANAVGINLKTLNFNQKLATANGPIAAAAVTLREIRLGQMEQTDGPAMIIASPLPNPLLGMSYLRLLDGYDIRDGKLSLF